MERALILLIALGVAVGFNLDPPENTWALPGHNFKLRCRSSLPLKSCSWTTPYGKNYPLSKGLTAESGRFEHFGKDDMDCGIVISKMESKDIGKWTCMVSVVNGSEVTTAEGQAMVAEAKEPESITLEGPIEDGVANMSLSEKVSMECVVSNAKPKPVISWYVDEIELKELETTEKDMGDVYTQTLMYVPVEAHENKTLKCVVEHVSLTESKEASVLIAFNDQVSMSESTDDKEVVESDQQMSFYIIGVLGAMVLFFCAFILISFAKGWFCFSQRNKSTEGVDGDEKLEKEPLDGGESSEDKTEEIAKPSEEAHQKLSERFASFFRLNKSGTVPETETAPEIDLEAGKTDEVDVDLKEADDKQVTEEEKPQEEVETKVEDETQIKFSKRFTAFFKKANKIPAENETETGNGNIEQPIAADESKAEEEKGEKDVEINEKSVNKTKTDMMSCLAGICNGGSKAEKNEGPVVEILDKLEEPEEKPLEYEPEDKDSDKPASQIQSAAPVQTPV